MARKRLSDLLREEGQKPEKSPTPESPTQSAEAPAAEPTASTEPAIAVEAELVAPPAAPVEDFVADLRNAAAPETPTSASLEVADPTPAIVAELESQLADLQAALGAQQQSAQAKVADLQELIANLEAKINHQEEEVQRFKAEAEQAKQVAQQLHTDLEEARQTILQLSQANAKPPAKSTPRVIESPRAAEPELETSTPQLMLPSRPIGTPRPAYPSFPSQPAASQPPAARPAASSPDRPSVPAPDRPPVHQLALRKMLDHPTQPGSLPAMSSEPRPPQPDTVKLTETDVGWMD